MTGAAAPTPGGDKKMRAWLVDAITEAGTMRFAEIPDPQPGPGEIVVAVEAAGLNFLDALMLRGKYQTRPPLPFTPGVECVGRILRAGPGSPLPPGTRVAASGQGSYAEQILLSAAQAHPIPDDIPAAAAVSLFGIAYATGWHAFHNRAALQPGETVLVHAAAGGVGSAAVQLAAAQGCHVIATAGGPDKVTVARAMGAELALSTTGDWVEAVRAHTGGRGVDVIFDPVGGDLGERSLRCLAWHGRQLVVGFAAGPIPALAANRLLLKESSAIGVLWGAARAADPALAPRVQAAILALYRGGALHPLIRHRFPLHQADEAVAALYGRTSVGKVVLEIPPP